MLFILHSNQYEAPAIILRLTVGWSTHDNSMQLETIAITFCKLLVSSYQSMIHSLASTTASKFSLKKPRKFVLAQCATVALLGYSEKMTHGKFHQQRLTLCFEFILCSMSAETKSDKLGAEANMLRWQENDAMAF